MNAIKQRGKPHLSLEAIDRQGREFGDQMSAILQRILIEGFKPSAAKGQKFIDTIPEFKELVGLIKDRLNLQVKFVHCPDDIAATYPLFVNKYHIFIKEYFRGLVSLEEQENFLRNLKKTTGTVDLKNAKLGGVFSEYVHEVFINPDILFQSNDIRLTFSAGEIAAILLHEIGHLFSHYERSDRLESTNLILADLALELKNDNLTKIEYKYDVLMKSIGKEDQLFITKGSHNKTILAAHVFAEYFGYVKSQLDNDTYDQTASEVSADVFASRFGYGQELVTGLDKLATVLGENDPSIRLMSRILADFATIIVPIALIVTFITTLGTSGFFYVVRFIIMIYLSLVFGTAGKGSQDLRYDENRDRYKRVRNEMVGYLKNPELDKKKVVMYLDQISLVDEIMKNTKNDVHSSLTWLFNLVIPFHRRAMSTIEKQQMLEDFAANDLFLKSAELRNAV